MTLPTDDGAAATLPLPIGSERMAELRAAIRRESNMNPLYPKHYATRSLFALVYEPLFKVDYEGKIVPVLAKSFTYDVETMTYRIQIVDGKMFHSGKKLTVQDVKASLIKTISLMTGDRNVEEPIEGDGETGAARSVVKLDSDLSASYQDGALFQPSSFSFMTAAKNDEYRNIRQISTEGSDVLLLELNRPDPHLVGLLTFPIISEADVDQLSTNPVSGSGSWRILSTERGQRITLERVGSSTGIGRITATAYDDAASAMRAFDEGELDVLVLDAAETSIYADRTRIKKQRFDYPGFISLFFRDGDRDAALLSRDYMVNEIRSDAKGDQFAAPFVRALYPILPGDYRLEDVSIPEFAVGDLPMIELPENETDPSGTTDDSGAPIPNTHDTREPFVLLVPDGFTPFRLVENIGACVARLGRKFTPLYISNGDWPSALRRNNYDAALLTDSTHLFLDPVDYLESLKYAGLFDWTEYVDDKDVMALREGQQLISAPEGAEHETFSGIAYAKTVSRVFASSPVLGLAMMETMVFYGNNVENTMSGNWHSPYENVEDLIIWRP